MILPADGGIDVTSPNGSIGDRLVFNCPMNGFNLIYQILHSFHHFFDEVMAEENFGQEFGFKRETIRKIYWSKSMLNIRLARMCPCESRYPEPDISSGDNYIGGDEILWVRLTVWR
ncbi:MAG: hypothetical protein PUH24_01945 [Prevotellaceae bacterium]|nr:hypothetical protein [Prevotellaceae bacterium]